MRLTSIIPLALGILLAASTSCQDDNNTIGSSIVQDDIAITVDSAFTVSGSTVPNSYIQSRTITQLIGRIDAGGFGKISSDFVTQFMPSSRIDTTGVTENDIDSLMLVMSVMKGDFVGDSIVPMGIEIYPLTAELPNPIYSNFDPEGYYDGNPLASAVYNLSATSVDTVYNYDYRQIRVKMPLELGKKFFREYKRDPKQFASPTAFAKVFPGVYIRNSYGSGRISTISSTMMTLYYRKNVFNESTKRDTVYKCVGNYFAVTPEIITNNNISLSVAESMSDRIAAGENVLMAPTGYDVKFRFPAPEVIASFKAAKAELSVINTLYFSIPGEVIENKDGIKPPEMILMIPESKRDEFFAGNDLPDNITEFSASWNSSTNAYQFGDISKYIISLMDKERITEEDFTFIITPVTPVYDTTDDYYGTQTLSALNPYVGNPAMVRILLDKAKVKLTFTSQSISK